MTKKTVYRIVLSFVTAGLLFAGLLYLEQKQRPVVITRDVVTAKKEIPEGFLFTRENIEEYLEISGVDEAYVGEDCFTELKQLMGREARVPMSCAAILQKGWFFDAAGIEKQMHTPVRVAIKTDDLSRTVGGGLRKGDFVNLYFLNEETGRASLTFRGVLVDQAMDSSGKNITREETERVSSMVTLLLEEADVEVICEEMNGGTFRMAKGEIRETPYERLEREIIVEE